jgi:hypothetical protein
MEVAVGEVTEGEDLLNVILPVEGSMVKSRDRIAEHAQFRSSRPGRHRQMPEKLAKYQPENNFRT